MKRAFTICALAFLFIGASSFAQGAEDASDARWYDAVEGQKFVAVDDSSITLSAAEDGLALQIVSPSGVARSLFLSFVADGVGTISDGGARPVGVFRETDNTLQADFSDGHTETFSLNSGGGISMVLSTRSTNAYCVRWYPEGHTFDVADRKAALAAYASKLGLSDQKAPPLPACDEQQSQGGAHAGHTKLQKHDAAPQVHLTTMATVTVRDSQVHTIDPVDGPSPQAAQLAPPPPLPQPAPAHVASVAPAPAPKMQLAADKTAPQPPADKPMQLAATEKTAMHSHEASSCLSVDTDGSGWGFRNGCDYDVQFAYCLKNGTDKSAACGSGTASGNVPGNGFLPVLANNEIVTAEEEFRWVACAGRTDQVAAHLDRSDPPAGRCVPVRAL